MREESVIKETEGLRRMTREGRNIGERRGRDDEDEQVRERKRERKDCTVHVVHIFIIHLNTMLLMKGVGFQYECL